MTSLSTNIVDIFLSSALPDLSWSTDAEDLHVRLYFQSPEQTLIDTTLTAINGTVSLYETRELVERYMRHNGITRLYPLTVQHFENSSWHSVASMTVIFCEKTMVLPGSVSQFLEQHFLSTRSAKTLPTDINAVEQLYFIQPEGTPPNPALHVTYINDQGEVATGDIALAADYNASLTNLFVCEFSVASIMAAVAAAASVIAVTVTVGNRHMEYYRPARRDHVAFKFRNAFNVFESAYLCAVVSRKTEDGRKIAHVAGGLAVYDRKPVTEYEVQTSPLSFEQASWIDQLITSPDVRLLDDTPLIITDGEAVCHNDNGQMNSAKFSYKESDERHSVSCLPQGANVFTVPPHSYQFS